MANSRTSQSFSCGIRRRIRDRPRRPRSSPVAPANYESNPNRYPAEYASKLRRPDCNEKVFKGSLVSCVALRSETREESCLRCALKVVSRWLWLAKPVESAIREAVLHVRL